MTTNRTTDETIRIGGRDVEVRRRCKRCGEIKPIFEFKFLPNPLGGLSDKRINLCTSCRRERIEEGKMRARMLRNMEREEFMQTHGGGALTGEQYVKSRSRKKSEPMPDPLRGQSVSYTPPVPELTPKQPSKIDPQATAPKEGNYPSPLSRTRRIYLVDGSDSDVIERMHKAREALISLYLIHPSSAMADVLGEFESAVVELKALPVKEQF